ncbi:hypothetical protein UF64_16265 [Thalassospira sp. HJ]|uniref:hypothetical protein n=1 Tax=Thalassospira sp. HJ TaxID=1616823 RepID=UPI0005CEDA84|nr:hypothetical protein [Thalassospira sp. HJ]KJE33993.1 hypothetical protein UF64_16265 [Thalassospira sp. HJ]
MASISGFLANSYSYLSSNAGQRSSVTAKSSDGSSGVSEKTSETAPASGKEAPAPGTLANAAANARAKIDAGYAKLGITGTSRTTADEWDEVGFPEFDRQMLYAVQSNEGGLFSDMEVLAAENEVANRISDIVNANPQNPTRAYREIVDFYDSASADEKASFEWAVSRASYQKAYILSGGTEDVSTDNPLVDKLTQAWDQVIARNGNSHDFPNMPAYRDALMWWSDANGGARHVDLSA